jgi:hypothetical protein
MGMGLIMGVGGLKFNSNKGREGTGRGGWEGEGESNIFLEVWAGPVVGKYNLSKWHSSVTSSHPVHI